MRGPTHRSRRSEGQQPRTADGDKTAAVYRPLVGRTIRGYSSSPTSRTGEVACFVWLPSPPVVRSFAPPTGGYDSSDPQGVGYTSRCNGNGRTTVRPYNRYTSRCTTTDAQTVRPYNRYSSCFNGNGRTTVRPYNRYSSRSTTTDARPSVPTTVTRLALTGTDAQIVRPYSGYSSRAFRHQDIHLPRKSEISKEKTKILHGGAK